MRLALSDIRDAVTWTSNKLTLRNSEEIPMHAARAIASITETSTKFGPKVSVRYHSKTSALDSLAKHLGMFVERYEFEHKFTGDETRLATLCSAIMGEAETDPVDPVTH